MKGIMIASNSSKTHVVIVGGGAAALEAKYAIRDFAGDRAAVEVLALERVISVDPENHRLLRDDRSELSYDFLVAAIPPHTGRRIVGLPFDGTDSLPIDHYGRIEGCSREYAAGLATTSRVRFQGTTAEHADVVASAIASEAEWPQPESVGPESVKSSRASNLGYSRRKDQIATPG